MTLQRFSFAFILFSLICSCSSDDKLNWQDVKKEIRQKFPDVKQLDIASFKKLKKENNQIKKTRSKKERKQYYKTKISHQITKYLSLNTNFKIKLRITKS